NGDGVIGVPTTVVEALGSVSLVKAGNNYSLGSSGPALKFNGVAYVAGEYGAWAPIGVEATATGYEVAWKMAGSDQYTVWYTNSSGNFVSNPLDGVSGANAGLQSYETSFQQDLNGDGVIGVPTTVVEALGSVSLVKAGNNYSLGSSGPALKFNGVA